MEVTGSTTCKEHLTGRWNKYAGARILKYVALHRKRVGTEKERWVAAGLLDPPPGQVMDEMVAGGKKDTGV